MYKRRYASQRIRGKLLVNRYLSASRKLKPLIPRTAWFSLSNLESMMNRFDAVYLKPDVGSLGKGIFRLSRSESGFELYEIKDNLQLYAAFGTLTEAYEHVDLARTSRLIIQEAVALERLDGRPYDIRVMVQRRRRGPWVCTGFMVKVGAEGKIVTNYHQGGELITMDRLGDLLALSAEQTDGRIRQLKRTALRISRTLSARRSGMHEMGIDFAYDDKQRLWVLEVNSNHPQFHPLKELDPHAYDRMMRFAASYGRRSAE